jgi:hypothetical protein
VAAHEVEIERLVVVTATSEIRGERDLFIRRDEADDQLFAEAS